MSWLAWILVRASASFGLTTALFALAVYSVIGLMLARRWDRGGEK